MAELVGLYKIKLSQTRYENGHFYLSIVRDGGKVIALDGRFVLDNDAGTAVERFKIEAQDSIEEVTARNATTAGGAMERVLTETDGTTSGTFTPGWTGFTDGDPPTGDMRWQIHGGPDDGYVTMAHDTGGNFLGTARGSPTTGGFGRRCPPSDTCWRAAGG